MYRNTPKPKNIYAKIASGVCLGLGLALILSANANLLPLPAIAQLLGIILLTAFIYIASVYVLRQYTFAVEPNPSSDDGELDFTIIEHKGKREITVCRIGLEDITLAREVTGNNKKQVKSERKNMKRYTYDTDFSAQRRIEVVTEFEDDRISILITYDAELLRALNNK